MKKLLLLLLSAFLFCSCEIGLGDSIYNCSVCNTVYNTKEEALNCRHTRYCPGASQEEIRDKENTIIKKEEEIVKKDEVITEQKETITQQEEEIAAKNQTIEDLNKRLGEIYKEIEEKLAYIRQLDQFIYDRRVQLGITEEDLANAQNSLQAVTQAIDKLIGDKERLTQEVGELNEKVVTLNTQITVLEEEKQALGRQIDQLNQTVTVLETNVKTLETEKQKLTESVKELNAKVDVLNVQVENLNRYIEVKNQQIVQLNQTVAEKEALIEEKQQKINQQLETIRNQNLTIEQKTARIEELDEEVAELEKDITKKAEVIEKQNATIAEQTEKIEVQQNTIDQQKTEIKEQQVTIEKQVTEIKELNVTIDEQAVEIEEKTEKIEEQKEIITQLSDALGSNLNFTSSGFTDKKEVYPDPYLGRAWEELWDNKHGQTEKDGKIYKGRQVGTKGVGYRGYSYFNYTNKLTVGSKNIVFRLTYDESFEDWSQTSSEEIRTIYDNDKVFQIYTGIVCLKPEEKIWVMKLVDMMDMNNSYYTLMKETGVNEFSTYGHYDVLTDCINADISGATWQKIDFSDLMVAE